MQEIYISTDIEADGPIPGPHSMLSIGTAAYTADKVLESTFSANLKTLPGAQPHPTTAEWWAKRPEAWAACRKDLELPERAMTRFVTWIRTLKGRPVFVAYPAGVDFLFVYWYLTKFVGESPSATLRSTSSHLRWQCSRRTTGKAPNETCRSDGSTTCRTRTSL